MSCVSVYVCDACAYLCAGFLVAGTALLLLHELYKICVLLRDMIKSAWLSYQAKKARQAAAAASPAGNAGPIQGTTVHQS